MDQLPLFGGPATVGDGESVAGRGVGAVEPSEEVLALADRLPASIHLGGSTWSFPGWAGQVYDRPYSQALLAREGLAAYGRHPLLRAVGLDRTHYQPLPAAEFARYAAAVPAGFLFLVKAHEACTVERWPDHDRYGADKGRPNPRFLDPRYAAEEVVGPYVEGLADKAGALLFEFAPQDLGPPRRFAERLQAFLSALPAGPRYAVELRNRDLLTADYAKALESAGAFHCLTVHPRMPDILTQAKLTRATERPITVGRWLLPAGTTYEEASRRFAPFNRLQAPDREARAAWAALATRARGTFLLTVNNNAEGSAPLSVLELARHIVGAEASP